MNERVERLRAALAEPLLVTNPVNVRYLTGFRSTNAAVLVEPDRVRLFTDFRYAEKARRLDGVDVIETSRNLLASIAGQLAGRVAFEADTVTYAGWETLRSGDAEPVPRRRTVERLRAVKDEEELDAIRRAVAVTDRAFERFARERFTGRSERELAWRLEQLLREEGAEAMAFPVVVAAGPTAASPHADPGGRPVGRGETVVVDAGAEVDGYCADCTRTFAAGELDARLRAAYDVCLDAQLAALAAVRAGVHGRDADAVARGRIDATEFAGLFGHGLGHGVGLVVHEEPVMRPESEDVLAPGNVVSVEPGIYLPGEGGVRIEDIVLVAEDGCDVLTRFPKERTAVT
ncbi:MAG: aminopeptidase P family protein [Thermoleophilia bacterium]|nr:aminopeptidase P family protein [Thermoleophilia bacterium]